MNIEDAKAQLTKLIRVFNYGLLHREHDDNLDPDKNLMFSAITGHTYSIEFLDISRSDVSSKDVSYVREFMAYLESKSGIQYLKYLNRLIAKLSNGRCYICRYPEHINIVARWDKDHVAMRGKSIRYGTFKGYRRDLIEKYLEYSIGCVNK